VHRLIAKQIAKATDATGTVDIDKLAALVGGAYEEFDHDRRRTDRSMSLMIEEIDGINRNLEQLVAKRSSELKARERDLQAQNVRFDIAINNMTQGLLLFDSSERLIVCNQSYMTMYALSPDAVKPGISLHDLVAYRKEIGSFNGEVDEYCTALSRSLAAGKTSHYLTETPDGRTILIVNKPVACSPSPWASTMAWSIISASLAALMAPRPARAVRLLLLLLALITGPTRRGRCRRPWPIHDPGCG